MQMSTELASSPIGPESSERLGGVPGIFSSLSTCPSMASVLHVSTGPTVRLSMLRFEAISASFFSNPEQTPQIVKACQDS